LLSLLVVPAVFTYIDDLEHWIKRMAGKASRKTDDADSGQSAAVALGKD
jgi:hypothetical protein